MRIERQVPLKNIWLLEYLRQEPLLMALRPDLVSLPMYRLISSDSQTPMTKDKFMNNNFLDLLRAFEKHNHILSEIAREK